MEMRSRGGIFLEADRESNFHGDEECFYREGVEEMSRVRSSNPKPNPKPHWRRWQDEIADAFESSLNLRRAIQNMFYAELNRVFRAWRRIRVRVRVRVRYLTGSSEPGGGRRI